MAPARGSRPAAGAGARSPGSSANKPNAVGKPNPGENTLAWHQRLPVGGAVKVVGVGLLVITGIAFLPGFLTDTVTDALFGWLPEEYRPMASAACSYSSCCCTCLSVILVIYMKMSSAE